MSVASTVTEAIKERYSGSSAGIPAGETAEHDCSEFGDSATVHRLQYYRQPSFSKVTPDRCMAVALRGAG
jgi:hypothetical protein